MYDIRAETYTKSDDFHYVKLEIDGVYISGIKVSESKKQPGTLWIQMPSYRLGQQWKRYIETENDSPLGQAMYRKIEELMAPKLLGSDIRHIDKTQDVVLVDIDVNEPIDLSDIPF